MMIPAKWILDPEEQKKFAAWRRTLPEEETGEEEAKTISQKSFRKD